MSYIYHYNGRVRRPGLPENRIEGIAKTNNPVIDSESYAAVRQTLAKRYKVLAPCIEIQSFAFLHEVHINP